MKKLSILLLALIMTISSALTLYAEDGSVTYKGSTKDFIFEPGSDYSVTDLFPNFKDVMPEITEEDMKLISEPVDFFGFNLYNGVMTKMGKDGKPERVKRYDGFPKTAIQWPVTPEAIRWATKFLYERYGKPIYITENGMSCHDWVALDGKVHDPNRIDFYHRYLIELKKSAEEGTDIEGYFAWSLMDNFEWTNGYHDRFGIIYVDYPTQKRIIKDSGCWYRDMIAENGENL